MESRCAQSEKSYFLSVAVSNLYTFRELTRKLRRILPFLKMLLVTAQMAVEEQDANDLASRMEGMAKHGDIWRTGVHATTIYVIVRLFSARYPYHVISEIGRGE